VAASPVNSPRSDGGASSPGSPGFSLSAFVSKYAATEDVTSTQEAHLASNMSAQRRPLRASASPAAALRASSGLQAEGAVSAYGKYQQKSKIVSSEELRSSYSAPESVSSSYHSQSLRELLGIREGEDLISINKYTRRSYDSGDGTGSDSSAGKPEPSAVFDNCADVDDDLSDEDDAGVDLVKEIDEMKARLMKVMHMPALSRPAAAAGASRLGDSQASDDASLSQHPLESQFISASSNSSTGDSSLSFHRLDAGSESTSKTSADEMFSNLDVALGRALASSSTSSTMEGMVQQYLQSMSSSSHHVISRSIADEGESDYGSLSGGNLSSLKTTDHQNSALDMNNDSASEDDVISV